MTPLEIAQEWIKLPGFACQQEAHDLIDVLAKAVVELNDARDGACTVAEDLLREFPVPGTGAIQSVIDALRKVGR